MKSKHIVKALILILVIILTSCSQKDNTIMDLILHNATVYTVDNDFTIVESIAVKDGKIIETGTSKNILGKYSAKKVIDCEGKYIYPGLIDPHSHFFGYGKSLINADLMGSKSFDEVIKRIYEHHKKYQSEWILGRGWDQNEWEIKEYPNKKQLDDVFPNTPVLLKRVDGHAAIANTEALNRAGIKKAKEVPGGLIHTKDSELTGLLIGNAIQLVDKIIPEPEEEVLYDALNNAQNNIFAVGLTSVSDAGLDKEVVELIDSLHKSNTLKVRIYAMLNPTEENFEHYVTKGHYKTDYLNVRSVKLFADGALGSRGAKLLEPYNDDPENYGILENEPDYIRKIAKRVYDNNYQLNIHCIGDSAVRIILNIYADILKKENDLRWRIEHAQIIHPDDFEMFGKYNIIPSVQAIHATSDMLWAIDRIGKDRLENSYALKKLLKQNGWIPNSSDFPIEPINPLYGFYSAVDRKNFEGIPEEGFQMENALSREEALRAMTIWAAKAQFEEAEKGSIEAEKFADFIILDNDLMTMPLKDILKLQIHQTYLNGELVFSK
ncbi:MAG: amidohydrolase [Bacteroidota bacterium]